MLRINQLEGFGKKFAQFTIISPPTSDCVCDLYLTHIFMFLTLFVPTVFDACKPYVIQTQVNVWWKTFSPFVEFSLSVGSDGVWICHVFKQ